MGDRGGYAHTVPQSRPGIAIKPIDVKIGKPGQAGSLVKLGSLSKLGKMHSLGRLGKLHSMGGERGIPNIGRLFPPAEGCQRVSGKMGNLGKSASLGNLSRLGKLALRGKLSRLGSLRILGGVRGIANIGRSDPPFRGVSASYVKMGNLGSLGDLTNGLGHGIIRV